MLKPRTEVVTVKLQCHVQYHVIVHVHVRDIVVCNRNTFLNWFKPRQERIVLKPIHAKQPCQQDTNLDTWVDRLKSKYAEDACHWAS